VSNFNSKLEVLEERTYPIQVSNHDFFCSLLLPSTGPTKYRRYQSKVPQV